MSLKNDELYRQEALLRPKDEGFGTIISLRPLAHSVLTAFVIAVSALCLMLIAFGSYTRKAHVQGYLAPSKGFLKVFSPQTGKVIARPVREGAAVQLGDPLVVVSSERSTEGLAESQSAVLTLLRQRAESLSMERGKQAEVDRAAANNLLRRLDAQRAELLSLRSEIELQERRVEIALGLFGRFKELASNSFVSSAQLQQRQDELLEQQGRAHAMQRTRIALEKDIQGSQNDLAISKLRAETNLAAIDRAISELKQQVAEADSRREFVITAPAAGKVTAILTDVGQTTATTAPLLSIVPAGARLEAHLLVPSKSSGFISVGQPVTVRYDSFPYQRFGHYRGIVQEMSQTPISAADVPIPVQLNEAVFRVIVRLESEHVVAYGKAIPLQPGASLHADIWLDKRSLIQWILDPIYSVTGRL